MKPFAFLSLLLISTCVWAQKKSELQYQIFQLKKEIQVKDDSIAELRKQRAATTTKLEAAEFEQVQLRQDNARLLESLNKFTSESVAQTENIAKGLQNLSAMELQLNQIREDLSANDSITIQVLTQLTQLLGQDPNLKVEGGSIQFRMTPAVFGATDSIPTNARIRRVNEILSSYPSLSMEVYLPDPVMDEEGKPTVASLFVTNLKAYYQSQPGLSQRVRFLSPTPAYPNFVTRIQPDYRAYYLKLRETLK